MSHTNSTTNYSLPQFLTTDKPAWLTDVNNAYLAIDTAMKNNADAASTADTKATNAGTAATNADTKATTAKNTADGAVASIADTFSATDTYSVGDLVMYNNLLYICTTAVTTPGAWTGSTNWTRITVDDLKQNKTDDSLDTTNKTVVGAINELNTGLIGVEAYRCKYAYTVWGTSRSSEYTHVPFFRVQIDLDYYIAANGGDYINIRNVRTGTTQSAQIPSGQTSVSVTIDGYTFTKNVSEGNQNLVITTPSNKPIFMEYYL